MKLFEAWVSNGNEWQLETLVRAWDNIQGSRDLDEEPDNKIQEAVFRIERLIVELNKVVPKDD